MELDRQSIERRDFPTVLRGYDRETVDRHLEGIAAAAEAAREAREAAPLASDASDQVRAIVEAAESSANELRETAGAEAAAHLRRVEEVTGNMLRRSQLLQTELDRLVEDLRVAASSIVEEMHRGAASLRSELQALREELPRARGEEVATAAAESGELRDSGAMEEPQGVADRAQPAPSEDPKPGLVPVPSRSEPAPQAPPAAASDEPTATEEAGRETIPIRGRPA